MTRAFSTYTISKEESSCLDKLKQELSFFVPRYLNDQALYESDLYKYHKRIENGEIQYDIDFLSFFITKFIQRSNGFKYIRPMLHYLLIYKSKIMYTFDDIMPIIHILNACRNRPQNVNKAIKEYTGVIKLYNYDTTKVLKKYLTVITSKGE